MKPATPSDFNRLYETHRKHLRLKGLQPKTIEAYARKYCRHTSVPETANFS